MVDRRLLMEAFGCRWAVVQSPSPPEECRRRLRVVVDETEAMFGTLSVVGDVENDDATLRIRLPLFMGVSNLLPAVMRARFVPEGSGTIVTCRLWIGPLTQLSLAMCLVALAAFWVFGLFRVMVALIDGNLAAQNSPWALVVIPPAAIVFELALVFMRRTIAREQDDYLIEYLRKSIDGRLI